MFKRLPIVVIRVPERQAGELYAQVTSAVRALADEYGLRVVVDGSPNSLPPELLTTNRERVLSVEPMSREMIESIPEFQDLVGRLKRFHLEKAVWQVLGGCPAKYLDVQSLITDCSDDAIVDKVRKCLVSVLAKAGQIVLKSSPNTKAIVKLFRERNVLQLSIYELEKLGLMIEYPNKVFKEVTREGIYVEPATSAVGLIIRENISSPQDEVDLVKGL
ncbi:MAG: hypothetical protein EOO06_20105 [Chitinophagaceae bacterium]|nr:MAG: hypothetical protein EOO06_20105 [Chitinophagaceae bacterium]